MTIAGPPMRKGILIKGLVLLAVSGILIVLGISTGRSETTVASEDVFDCSYLYDFLGNHEYKAVTSLLPGTYNLRYSFSSDEPVKEFYVSLLDPDDYEIESIYGPPAEYQHPTSNLTVETQKTGQYTLILGGKWLSVQVNIYKLTQSAKMVYPYEIAFYAGLPLLTGSVALSIVGVLMKEKPTYWLDKL